MSAMSGVGADMCWDCCGNRHGDSDESQSDT
jgi:hypothetical protein